MFFGNNTAAEQILTRALTICIYPLVFPLGHLLESCPTGNLAHVCFALQIVAMDPSCCGGNAPGADDLVIHFRNYKEEIGEQYANAANRFKVRHLSCKLLVVLRSQDDQHIVVARATRGGDEQGQRLTGCFLDCAVLFLSEVTGRTLATTTTIRSCMNWRPLRADFLPPYG